VKKGERDALDMVDMLRLGRLPPAWIAPPATRELRELVRYRAKLVALCSGLKAPVHAVLAKEGVLPATRDQFGKGGNAQLDALELGDCTRCGCGHCAISSPSATLERSFYDRLPGD